MWWTTICKTWSSVPSCRSCARNGCSCARSNGRRLGPGRLRRGSGSCGGVDLAGEPPDRRLGHELAQRYLDAEVGAKARNQPDGQERMAADLEEAVLPPDPVPLEELGPDRAD